MSTPPHPRSTGRARWLASLLILLPLALGPLGADGASAPDPCPSYRDVRDGGGAMGVTTWAAGHVAAWGGFQSWGDEGHVENEVGAHPTPPAFGLAGTLGHVLDGAYLSTDALAWRLVVTDGGPEHRETIASGQSDPGAGGATIEAGPLSHDRVCVLLEPASDTGSATFGFTMARP